MTSHLSRNTGIPDERGITSEVEAKMTGEVTITCQSISTRFSQCNRRVRAYSSIVEVGGRTKTAGRTKKAGGGSSSGVKQARGEVDRLSSSLSSDPHLSPVLHHKQSTDTVHSLAQLIQAGPASLQHQHPANRSSVPTRSPQQTLASFHQILTSFTS